MFIHEPTYCLVLSIDDQDILNDYMNYIFDKTNEFYFGGDYVLVLTSNKDLKFNNRLVKIIYKEKVDQTSRAEVYNDYKHIFRFIIFGDETARIKPKETSSLFKSYMGKYWDYLKLNNFIIVRGNLEKLYSLDNLEEKKSLLTLNE